jgi:hypothetical protein
MSNTEKIDKKMVMLSNMPEAGFTICYLCVIDSNYRSNIWRRKK